MPSFISQPYTTSKGAGLQLSLQIGEVRTQETCGGKLTGPGDPGTPGAWLKVLGYPQDIPSRSGLLELATCGLFKYILLILVIQIY